MSLLTQMINKNNNTMNNKILNFDAFAKGPGLNDPKKLALTMKPDVQHKEKTLDQVKRADLTQPKVTEPDYTQISKNPIQESSVDTQAEIDSINQTKELRAKLVLATTDADKLNILNQIKVIQQQSEQKAKAAKVI